MSVPPERVFGIFSVPIRQASIASAPVPHFATFSATVPSSGLRARMIGSHPGLSAVPYPFHCFASSVAGAVTGTAFVGIEPIWTPYVPALFRRRDRGVPREHPGPDDRSLGAGGFVEREPDVEALRKALAVHPGKAVTELEPRVFDGNGKAMKRARPAEDEQRSAGLQDTKCFLEPPEVSIVNASAEGIEGGGRQILVERP